jgi:hypothetical protein
MPELGWIKIHRKIGEKAFYKKSCYIHLWIHLLLNANHKQKEFIWNNKMILIKEGQLLTGRKELSRETGIPESTIERILDFLENEQQIAQEKTTKFRVITIINWKDYQDGQQTDNRRTTDGQQTDTNKNVKNEENDKNKYISDDEIQKIWIKTFGRNPKQPEYDFTINNFIKKFGSQKTERIFKEGVLSGFQKVKTLWESIDENGNIKPKDSKPEGKTIDYNPA